MAFRWRSPDGKTGSWFATEAAAKTDAIHVGVPGRSLTLTVEPEFVPALFQSLAREGWYIEEGRP